MSNGTQLFLDNATRANENPLSDGGAWANAGAPYSNLQLLSNLIEASASATNCAMRLSTWAALGGKDDQYLEIVINATLAAGTGDAIHLWARSDSNRQNAYLLKIANNDQPSAIIKIVAGAATSLATLPSLTPTAGDRFRLTVVGSQITVYKNQQYVITVQDADVTTGLPGIFCNSLTIAATAIREFRAGNPYGNVGGPWTKKGSILHATTADINSHLTFSGISNQTAMYDNNVQLITPNADGKVHKIWFMAGNAITYAESQTALPGSWTRQTVTALATFGLPRVYRSGSTYYAFVSHLAAGPWTHVDLYTCNNGDNNWVLAQADVIVSGGAGSWDEQQAAYFSVVGQIAGTWYALYNGQAVSGVYGMGLATASALTGPWTKYVSNPVVTKVGTPEHMVQFGNTWYGWLANSTNGASNIVRMSTTDFINWSTKVVSIQPENQFEGINTNGTLHGAISVPSIVEANGACTMYYSCTTSDATPATGYVVTIATAPYTMAQLITGEEYFASQPVTFTDVFGRANANPIGAPYITETGSNDHQIVSNKVEVTALNVTSRSVYTGAVPALSAAQFTEITVAQLLTGAFANPLVRMSSGAVTQFGLTVGGPTGSNFNCSINRIVAGSGSILAAIFSVPISVGDVFRLRALDISNNGVLVSAYQNGNLIYEVTDFNAAPIASGNPGFGSFAATAGALTDSQISQFRAGNANIPYTPASLSGTIYVIGSNNRHCTHGLGPQAVF